MTPSSSTRWTTGFIAVAVITAALFAYWPAMGGGYVFDDHILLGEYDCWKGLERIPRILGLEGDNACIYRPVRFVSFALDYSIAGESPAYFHFSNLVYHLLCGLAVFFLLRRWGTARAAAVCAAIWVLHPVNSDAVAYISGRRDVLSSLLYVLAFLQLIPRSAEELRLRRIGFGILLLLLAFNTKEMAVTLPAMVAVAALLDTGSAGRAVRRIPTWSWLALVGLAAAFVLQRGVLSSHSHMQGLWWGNSVISNFATALALIPRYAELAFWPARLIGDYHHETIPLASSFSDLRSLLGLAILVGVVVAIVFAVRKGHRPVAMGLTWLVVALTPVMHLFPHHELFAEHYLYLPLIGLMIALLPAVERVLGWRPPRRTVGVVVICSVCLL